MYIFLCSCVLCYDLMVILVHYMLYSSKRGWYLHKSLQVDLCTSPTFVQNTDFLIQNSPREMQMKRLFLLLFSHSCIEFDEIQCKRSMFFMSYHTCIHAKPSFVLQNQIYNSYVCNNYKQGKHKEMTNI